MIDKSNAFHSIPHGKLIDKCRLIGILGCFLNLIKSYLDDRKQFVIYNNNKSDLIDVTSGSPQGGVISPTLFNRYVHDLPKVCNNSYIFQCADDSAIVNRVTSHHYKQT